MPQSLTTQFLSPLNFPKPIRNPQFRLPKQHPFNPIHFKCSVSTASDAKTHLTSISNDKPFPAEISRTIMELSSVGTLSSLTPDGWPLGVCVKFAVDSDGTPVLCLNRNISGDKRSSLHVQLEQCGVRSSQCTIQGVLDKPGDKEVLNGLYLTWKNKFGEEASEDSLYRVKVDRVLQLEDLMEDGVWVTSSDYKNAIPDPLRDFAQNIVDEINANNIEDILRFSSVFVESDLQVTEAKMLWVDRLGFDLRVYSPPKGAFDVRIPFPREVTDEKGAKSSFNCMSQLAWEMEKHYQAPEFNKVKHLKQVAYKSR